jgi:hypothetical protein
MFKSKFLVSVLGAVSVLGSVSAANAVPTVVDPCKIGNYGLYNDGGIPIEPELEPLWECRLSTVTGANQLPWAAGQEGDLVLIAPGSTVAGCITSLLTTDAVAQKAAQGPGSCISDVARVVNDGGRSKVYFASDDTPAADLLLVPPLPAGHAPIIAVVKPAVVSPLNTLFTSKQLNNGVFLDLRISSHTGSLGPYSDAVFIGRPTQVPMLPPFAVGGMGALLLGISTALLKLTQRRANRVA